MPDRTIRRFALLAALATVTATLSACDVGSDTEIGATTSAERAPVSETVAPPNAADRTFASAMSVHGEAGVAMAELATGQASDGALGSAAQHIADNLRREVDLLLEWSAERGTPSSTTSPGAGGPPAATEGTDAGAALSELAALSGAAFDARFVQLMLEHHWQAITIAEQEREAGRSAEMLELAATIIDDRHEEITELEQLIGGS